MHNITNTQTYTHIPATTQHLPTGYDKPLPSWAQQGSANRLDMLTHTHSKVQTHQHTNTHARADLHTHTCILTHTQTNTQKTAFD